MHEAVGNTAIAFTAVRPLPRLPLGDAAFLQILETCAYPLPAFPYTHTYATTQPLVCVFQEATHVGVPKVGHPTSDCLGQHLLAPRIADVPAAACQLFELSAQLGFRLRVDAQASLSLSCVEGVAKVFLTVHAPYMGLLAVHLQEKLLLDETADTLADSFGGTRTLAEDNAIVGIADKRKTTAFEFAVKLVEHDVAQ